ncbi:MAG: hypothetical protein LBL74_07755 [Bacteroidales bacterium]|nr:hypothetical protein [Bacteroidales bacterium]
MNAVCLRSVFSRVRVGACRTYTIFIKGCLVKMKQPFVKMKRCFRKMKQPLVKT